jgi:hypothetical protein
MAGSVQSIPSLPQKCCSPAILVVGLFGILDLTPADAAVAPWLVATAAVNVAARTATGRVRARARFMSVSPMKPWPGGKSVLLWSKGGNGAE